MLVLTLLTLLIRRLFITRIILLIYLFSILLIFNGYCYGPLIEIYNHLWVISYKRGIIGICMLILGILILYNLNNLKGEKSLIISINLIAMITIITCKNWLLFILSLELLTYSTSILVCIDKYWESTRSSGLKYFLIGAFSSGFILLGITVLYSNNGLFDIIPINSLDELNSGLLLILSGILFKIGAAPFHYWAPDVYDGVPTIITSWISIFPKLTLLVFLYYLNIEFSFINKFLINICSWLSIIIGSFLGIIQYRIKRLLAYSSITHIGFILLSTNYLSEIANFYIIQYALTSFTLFLILMSYNYNIQTISQLNGKILSNIYLAITLNILLFSLAGLPPFIGFFAKIKVLELAINSQYWLFVFTVIITTVVGCVQYLRIINILNFSNIYSNIPIVINNFNSHTIALITFFILLGYIPNIWTI